MLVQALLSLRPNTEFVITDNDIKTIVWHTEGVTTPTKKQIEDEIKRLEAIEAEKPAAKAALLERLGITAEEASLLLS